jgi:DNA invertase Pin-like site-specific DNA recombinase
MGVIGSTAAGRAFFGRLAVFAAFETDVRRARQLQGMAMARWRGAGIMMVGGPPFLTPTSPGARK